MTAITCENNYVMGSFRNRNDAEKAFQALKMRGYSRDDIDVLMSDETRTQLFENRGGVAEEMSTGSLDGSRMMESAGVGGAIGVTLGAIIASLAAVGSIVVPGIGLVAAGPIAAAFAGAGAGGLSGGLLGALVGAGLSEDNAKHHESHLREGGVVVGLRARTSSDARAIEDEWRVLGTESNTESMDTNSSQTSDFGGAGIYGRATDADTSRARSLGADLI